MKKASLYFICLISIIAVAVSCGGGGGGGGGAVAFKQNSGFHNGGDAGGWGTGNATGNGFGGNGGGLGSSGDSNIVITGSTPLEVGTYTYNGASYDSVEALYAALAASTLEDVFYVDFQVEGESSPRTARVTANGKSNDGNDILIEHQYKALFPDGNGGSEEVLFYKRDGIELPGGSGTVTIDDFEFEKGWQIDGSFAPAGSIIGVASGGDVDLQNRAVLKTAVYGYKADTGASGGYILGFNSSELTAGDTVTVTTDRKITKLKLPSTSIGFLDLSGATDFKTVNLEPDNAGSLQEIKLPSNAETIAMSAFSGCTNLNSVTLPSTLTSIQTEAFLGCSNLQSITIPAGVTSLADDTFKNCSSLSSVTFAPGSQLTTINKRVFEGCSSLSTITLPSTLTSISDDAFKNCSGLTSINIPSNVTSIGSGAFNGAGDILGMMITFEGNKKFQSVALPDRLYKVTLENGVPTNSSNASIFQNDTNLIELTFQGGQLGVNNTFAGCIALATVTFNSYPSDVSSRSNVLPNETSEIIFMPGMVPITNVSSVGNLFASGRNFSSTGSPLTVTFENGSSSIRINSNAFNFDGAENIIYQFSTDPPDTNMIYDDGTCFKSVPVPAHTGAYIWTSESVGSNGSIGRWL